MVTISSLLLLSEIKILFDSFTVFTGRKASAQDEFIDLQWDSLELEFRPKAKERHTTKLWVRRRGKTISLITLFYQLLLSNLLFRKKIKVLLRASASFYFS
jgi:hypothetical protein